METRTHQTIKSFLGCHTGKLRAIGTMDQNDFPISGYTVQPEGSTGEKGGDYMAASNQSASISGFAVRFLDFNGCTYETDAITQEVLDHMISFLQTAPKASVFLSLDEYGEDGDSCLSIDIQNGWAALAFCGWDENGISYMYQPMNNEGNSLEEAPVCIGGQTPVSKQNALQDMRLVVECVCHFAKTGERYPVLSWERCSP